MSEIVLKEQLLDFCKGFVNERKGRIESQIKEVHEALGSETKSSAGDKHETGRAMLQLEREKLGTQLAEVEKMAKIINKVDITTKKDSASLGSLVCTDSSNYFLAISAGEYKSTEKRTYCISMNTPIGIILLGKKVDDVIDFNGNQIKILQVL
ncbi:3-oxoacyl-ACP synthase [Maribacter sp. HTCC2170]|uniref:3-oxoacyl-ACP synthase n=1 Tax=Maribacter sp. (strain HTCC2170 / KCCM 42371) TaxID=313603 RepID=UPI00006BD371|nr:3-oxoacyl-ACP synthase [Maribacter sp. HTCC2170]EAR02876.1 hypothetical protein FB2170_06295 [Maribacter sp. HTCC2170]